MQLKNNRNITKKMSRQVPTNATNVKTQSLATGPELRHEDGKFTYAIFSENNFDEMEAWYTFIRKEENEEALHDLKKIIDEIDWGFAPSRGSSFAIDTSGVSEKTAKEMCMAKLENYYFHSKFDGKMKPISISLEGSDRKRARQIYDLLGGNNIADYLSDEDLAGCELCNPDEMTSDDSAYSDSECYSYSSDDESSRKTAITADDLPPILKSSLATEEQ